MNDEGASPVIGTMLMMGLMMSLVPGAIIMFQSWGEVQTAFTERNEQLAYCVRNPNYDGPECPDREYPGADYDCRWVDPTTYLCTKKVQQPNPPRTDKVEILD